MIFYLDTEFNSFGGDLLTLALVSEDKSVPVLYVARNDISLLNIHPWVKDNVLPVIVTPKYKPTYTSIQRFGQHIVEYFKQHVPVGDEITIVADWPDDIRYMMMALITGPGTMVNINDLNICLRRCDPYKNNPMAPHRHNAVVDAMAMKDMFQ